MDGRTGGGLLVVAVLVLAAGCVGIVDDETAGEGDNGTAIEASNQTGTPEQTSEQESDEASSQPPHASIFQNATRQPLDETNATALLGAEVEMDDPAGLQGFTWEVPAAAVIEHPAFSSLEDPPETVALRGASVVEGGDEALEAWGLFAYDLSGDEAQVLSVLTASPATVESQFPAPAETRETEAEAYNFVLYLGTDELEAGDRVGFVLAARGASGNSFGVGLQPIVDPPDDDDPEPAEDLEELRGSAPETVLLPREGSGDGLHLGSFIDLTGPLVPYRQTVWTPAVEVEEGVPTQQPPLASARSTTVQSSFSARDGWATANGASFDVLGAEAGRWQVEADLHGTQVNAGGPFVDAPFLPLGPAAGFPFFSATDGGSGGSEATFTVEGAGVHQWILFTHLGLGDPLETLVGSASATDSSAPEGPTIDPVVVHTSEAQWTFAGGPGPSISMLGFPFEAVEPALSG